MANPEHVKQLKEGVEAWNAFRGNNWGEHPVLNDSNLSGANLRDADLSFANLIRADLSGADLSFANLIRADLSGANLRDASLYQANLKETNLSSAILHQANLSITCNLQGATFNGAYLNSANLSNATLTDASFRGANLSNAILINTNLRDANLSRAILCDAHLSNANLSDANLSDADLSRVSLSKADLRGANLSDTNLSDASLIETNLSHANLSGANLSGANLSGANLSVVQSLDTNFKAATLTGICLEDWHINAGTDFQGVVCEFIFFKYNSQQTRFVDRRPHDPNAIFKPGEFVALVQQSLETLDLIFLDGIDWKAFFQSFQQLQSKYQDDHLNIQAIEKKPDGAFVIRLEVDFEADRAEIELDSKSFYENQLRILEAQYEERLRLQGSHLEDARNQIEAERQEKATLYGVMKTMAENQGPKYDQRGSNFGNFVDTAQPGSRIQSIQHNYASPEKQPLAEAAAAIQQLLKQLEQTNPTATEAEKEAFVTAAIPPTLRKRVISALQSSGKAAIEEFLDNPYVNVGIAIIEGWQQADAR